MLFLSCVIPPLAAGRVHANYKVRRLVGYLFSVGVYFHNFCLAESVGYSNCKNM